MEIIEQKKIFSSFVRKSTIENLKRYSKQHGITQSYLVDKAITEKIKKLEKK